MPQRPSEHRSARFRWPPAAPRVPGTADPLYHHVADRQTGIAGRYPHLRASSERTTPARREPRCSSSRPAHSASRTLPTASITIRPLWCSISVAAYASTDDTDECWIDLADRREAAHRLVCPAAPARPRWSRGRSAATSRRGARSRSRSPGAWGCRTSRRRRLWPAQARGSVMIAPSRPPGVEAVAADARHRNFLRAARAEPRSSSGARPA